MVLYVGGIVLILVVVEFDLTDLVECLSKVPHVLILVVVEFDLTDKLKKTGNVYLESLNPCCSGI